MESKFTINKEPANFAVNQVDIIDEDIKNIKNHLSDIDDIISLINTSTTTSMNVISTLTKRNAEKISRNKDDIFGLKKRYDAVKSELKDARNYSTMQDEAIDKLNKHIHNLYVITSCIAAAFVITLFGSLLFAIL